MQKSNQESSISNNPKSLHSTASGFVVDHFWYREVDEQGVEFGLDRFKGFHDGQRLVLGIVEIQDSSITDAEQADEVLSITWIDQESSQRQQVRIRVYKQSVQVKRAVDFGLSRRRFQEELESHAALGVGHQIRGTVCPYCSAYISSMDADQESPQVYCQYCDSIVTVVHIDGLGDTEKDFRLCDQCGMYSRPRHFSIAYFYFLIFHAGVHHRQVHRCAGCMRRSAWLMLFGNLPFLLGLPLAISQLFRVYGDSIRRGPFRGLDKANLLMQYGKNDRALDEYAKIIERHPVSAGVLYNIAIGLLKQDEQDAARRTLEMAVDNCSNYPPAKDLLTELTSAQNPNEAARM